jgi:Tat protein translocase TatB subunit
VFEVGMTELVLLFVVALLILGPDKLPDFARRAGSFMRRLRQQAEAARRMVEDELALGEHGDAYNELRRLRGEVAQLRAVVSTQAQHQQWWLPAADQEGRQGSTGSGVAETAPAAEPAPAVPKPAGQATASATMAPDASLDTSVRLGKDGHDPAMVNASTAQAEHEDVMPPRP